MLGVTREIRCMRDPTRGGVSSTLNEIAQQSRVGIELQESSLPIHEQVQGACELLGLDPLYVANEGKLIAIVAPEAAEALLQAMRHHPLGAEAQIIGTVTEKNVGAGDDENSAGDDARSGHAGGGPVASHLLVQISQGTRATSVRDVAI